MSIDLGWNACAAFIMPKTMSLPGGRDKAKNVDNSVIIYSSSCHFKPV